MTRLPALPTQTAPRKERSLPSPLVAGTDGSNTCSVAAILHSYELTGATDPEAQGEVTARGQSASAICDAAKQCIPAQRAAAMHTGIA